MEAAVRFEQTFHVQAPPEAVFDYMTDPANLAAWQTSKTSVEPLTEGPPRLGYRVLERTKPPGLKEFEEVVEFVGFDRPGRFAVHIVEGPYPVDGVWTLQPEGDAGTRAHFVAHGELRGAMRLLGPIAVRMMTRQFKAYHAALARNVEAQAKRRPARRAP
jgi:carbon monoxide dehydrogenase subunit G